MGSRSYAAMDIAASVCALSHQAFVVFWEEVLKYCIDVANRFCAHLVFLYDEVKAFGADDDNCVQTLGEFSLEAVKFLEEFVESLLQKVGVFLQVRPSKTPTR